MVATLQNIHYHKIRFLTQPCLLNTFLFVHVPSVLYLFLSEKVLYIQILKISKEKQHNHYIAKMVVKSQKKISEIQNWIFFKLSYSQVVLY